LLAFVAFLSPVLADAETTGSCESLRSQIKALQKEHREKRRKLGEKERERGQYDQVIALHEGRVGDVSDQRALDALQRLLKVGENQIRLLEKVRENSRKKPESQVNHRDLNDMIAQEISRQNQSNQLARDEIRESRQNLEKLKKMDVGQARKRAAALETELESLMVEVAKVEDPLLALRDKAVQTNCAQDVFVGQKDSAPIPLRAGEGHPDKKTCDRLLEMAKPAEKKYYDAAKNASAFEREYAEAQLIERAAKDNRLFENADKVLRRLQLRLLIAKEKEAIIASAASSEPAEWLSGPSVEFLQKEFDQSQAELNRMRDAVASFKNRTMDDQRELIGKLASKKTTLANELEAAQREHKKAMEPFEKANCKLSVLATLMPLMQMSMGVLGTYRTGLWDGGADKSRLGWPAVPFQAMPAPPPGTTR